MKGPIVQVAIALVAFVTLALAPPRSGKLLLVPLTDAAERSLPVSALNAGFSLVGRGPIRGSLVVFGKRDRLPSLLDLGILVVAAPPVECGILERSAA